MKNIKYLVFTILMLVLNIFYVKASCTDEEIDSLKELAKEIKVSYKHKGKVVNEDDEIYYNLFEVKVKNISDDMYMALDDGVYIFTPVDGQIVETFNNGTWNFNIYSNKCEDKIDTIKVYIPRFNILSLDPLCEGIDGDDFALCGKYYEYDVDYDNFVARVKHYRATYKIYNNEEIEKEVNKFEIIFNNMLDYIVKYNLYVIISLLILLVIITIIIIIKKRKKRGVLE